MIFAVRAATANESIFFLTNESSACLPHFPLFCAHSLRERKEDVDKSILTVTYQSDSRSDLRFGRGVNAEKPGSAV